jgi:hypothetical protein
MAKISQQQANYREGSPVSIPTRAMAVDPYPR